MPSHSVLVTRLRSSALLILLGMIVELLTLIGVRALAFVVFVVLACPLVVAGMGLFLWTIVSHEPAGTPSPSVPPKPQA
jgi:hypothetical protein